MPTYEFRCPEGHDFEKFYRKISDAEAVVWCPTCGEIAQRRLSAGAGLLFKGSGFYITDYGKDGKKDLKPAAKGGEGSNSGGEPASGESKSGDSKSGESTSGESKPAESKPATAKAESKPAGKPEGKPESKPAPKASGSAE